MKTFIPITENVRQAIIKIIVDRFGTKQDLAKKISVDPSTVGRWVKPGARGSIESDIYIKLLPYIQEFFKRATGKI